MKQTRSVQNNLTCELGWRPLWQVEDRWRFSNIRALTNTEKHAHLKHRPNLINNWTGLFFISQTLFRCLHITLSSSMLLSMQTDAYMIQKRRDSYNKHLTYPTNTTLQFTDLTQVREVSLNEVFISAVGVALALHIIHYFSILSRCHC